MDALALREELFSKLHGDVFKARGFKKRGHWLVRDLGPLVQSAYLRASRFGSQDEAIFWIDIQIFSESWLKLVFPSKPYKIPSEGTPSLFSRELADWCGLSRASHRIEQKRDAIELLPGLRDAAQSGALPFLDSCETPERLLTKLVELRVDTDNCLGIVGLSRLLGHEEQAQRFMALAKQNAANENDLRFLQFRERAIWRDTVQ